MVTYQVVEELLWGQCFGAYQSFGICARQTDSESTEPIAYYSDVFLSRETAEHFADLCNRLKLDLIHLQDAIEDAVAGVV